MNLLLIAHRGCYNGPNLDSENHPNSIDHALNLGFDAEVDVWYSNKCWWLGHNKPQYKIELEYLCNSKLWCHAKNLITISKIVDSNLPIHYFFHQNDDCTLTSKNFIWTYPNKPVYSNKSIIVLKNKYDIIPTKAIGICSDYVMDYKK